MPAGTPSFERGRRVLMGVALTFVAGRTPDARRSIAEPASCPRGFRYPALTSGLSSRAREPGALAFPRQPFLGPLKREVIGLLAALG
jgi:hypothetical protein